MASFETSVRDSLPEELASLILESAATNTGISRLLAVLLSACRAIGTQMRDGLYQSTALGSTNDFGDHQLHVDVMTDELLFNALKSSGVVHVAASEENPVEIECGGTGSGFSAAFDPLDGSSIIDANFAVGTILGIWPGRGLLGRTGEEQIASMICQYGPKVTMALALNRFATLSGEPIVIIIHIYTSNFTLFLDI
jgi:sedoheptulose-bisphosphatase